MELERSFRRQTGGDILIETSVVIHEDSPAPRNRKIATFARRNHRAIFAFLIIVIITIIIAIVWSLATGESGNDGKKTVGPADEIIPA